MSAAIDVKSPARDCVAWGRTTIDYDITYRARKTLAISVHPDLRVSVTAPLGADPEAIRAKVRKRAAWIRDQWRELVHLCFGVLKNQTPYQADYTKAD